MRVDAAANREAIVEAAKNLFADVGVDVPVRRIAAQAGVGMGTLYRHFPDRMSLVVGVADAVYERLDAAAGRCEQAWGSAPEAAWAGFVHELAALRLGRLLMQVGGSSELFAAGGPGPGLRERALTRIAQVLERAHAAGLVRQDVDPIRFQVGVVELSRPLGAAVDEMAPGWQDWLVDVYLRGLRP
ncbi:TetR/AcrR family transcriptional regulator [Actinomyces sp. 594]|uniref:TetR/AcrR family transcriptional regulator n=1 Tax=Actinomyces sp. 594 TaxID=2057793 RepID=UPI001C577241|nr:TetR/AcrR family transcriptional regulator [Actinomyces sp. 594]MBW3068656.1 TetR/AcrR family transcriptional regulator [Actinomyces sp. 594]